MAKDPAFLFYPGDWLGGTMGFSRHEKGAYIDLLMCQFNNGHMDEHMVLAILGEKDHKDIWEKRLKKKFNTDSEGRFFNQKLEYEMVRRKEYTESRRKNLHHMEAHMENGNGNGIKKGGKGGNKCRGVGFSEDQTTVVFQDGSMQKLGEGQIMDLRRGNLSARSITKGSSPY